MKKILFLLLGIFLLTVSCEPTELGSIKFFYVLYNPDQPDSLWVTSGDVPPRENGQSITEVIEEYGYQIPNDGSREHEISVDYSEDGENFRIDFYSTFPIDEISFEEYKYRVTRGESIPWERNSSRTHYILIDNKNKLEERDNGYFVFSPLIH